MTGKTLAVVAAFCFGLATHSVGFAGSNTTTNDWFDASFIAETIDTALVQGGTTGITRGAGSWTSVPANGTATIIADVDAGEGATRRARRGSRLARTPRR